MFSGQIQISMERCTQRKKTIHVLCLDNIGLISQRMMNAPSVAVSLLLLTVMVVVLIEATAADAPIPSEEPPALRHPKAPLPNHPKAHIHHYRTGKRRIKLVRSLTRL